MEPGFPSLTTGGQEPWRRRTGVWGRGRGDMGGWLEKLCLGTDAYLEPITVLLGADALRQPRNDRWMWGCALGIEHEASSGVFRTWTQGWRMNFESRKPIGTLYKLFFRTNFTTFF